MKHHQISILVEYDGDLDLDTNNLLPDGARIMQNTSFTIDVADPPEQNVERYFFVERLDDVEDFASPEAVKLVFYPAGDRKEATGQGFVLDAELDRMIRQSGIVTYAYVEYAENDAYRATYAGAESWLAERGFRLARDGISLESYCRGDDGAEDFHVSVSLPPEVADKLDRLAQRSTGTDG